MQIFLRILKEIGIAIVILIVLTFAGFMLFRSQLPFLDSAIPEPVKYAGINAQDYAVVGNLEDSTDPTKTYEATNTNLRGLESDRKILTGASNPFVIAPSVKTDSDVPTEKVTIKNSANPKDEVISNTEQPATTTTTNSDGAVSLE